MNKTAIFSFIAGILSLVMIPLWFGIIDLYFLAPIFYPTHFIISIVGLVTGIISLSKIKEDKSQGKLFSILGIVFSGITLLFAILFFIFLLFVISQVIP